MTIVTIVSRKKQVKKGSSSSNKKKKPLNSDDDNFRVKASGKEVGYSSGNKKKKKKKQIKKDKSSSRKKKKKRQYSSSDSSDSESESESASSDESERESDNAKNMWSKKKKNKRRDSSSDSSESGSGSDDSAESDSDGKASSRKKKKKRKKNKKKKEKWFSPTRKDIFDEDDHRPIAESCSPAKSKQFSILKSMHKEDEDADNRKLAATSKNEKTTKTKRAKRQQLPKPAPTKKKSSSKDKDEAYSSKTKKKKVVGKTRRKSMKEAGVAEMVPYSEEDKLDDSASDENDTGKKAEGLVIPIDMTQRYTKESDTTKTAPESESDVIVSIENREKKGNEKMGQLLVLWSNNELTWSPADHIMKDLKSNENLQLLDDYLKKINITYEQFGLPKPIIKKKQIEKTNEDDSVSTTNTFMCSKDHEDITHFKDEPYSFYCKEGALYSGSSCGGECKRIFVDSKGGDDAKTFRPSTKAPLHHCSSRLDGCNYAICHKCYQTLLLKPDP